MLGIKVCPTRDKGNALYYGYMNFNFMADFMDLINWFNN